ncbi:ig-like domain-containing protein [Nephila pilipes]|uniref:Ig-like domain-containing protein n=1 Tax=Nephila pilipes TaxID=299642 RepID=A0A8X6PAW3_NEPPI|nr:ig-like domain-containing protein [Nephila pilipes]GFT55043.1 ig-like domain-containing protein [Nephila pilipes]GFU13588.1 ig-like domain-containing protein [Nephila pilipes]GFU56503.1 ig-like domain-containing protein [Nephila pilipes]
MRPNRKTSLIGNQRANGGVLCLRLVSLHVPSKVIVGDVIKLTCRYDLEGDTLYSIKWYRDDVEFFRFVPRDKPPGQFFPLQGVTVDVSTHFLSFSFCLPLRFSASF